MIFWLKHLQIGPTKIFWGTLLPIFKFGNVYTPLNEEQLNLLTQCPLLKAFLTLTSTTPLPSDNLEKILAKMESEASRLLFYSGPQVSPSWRWRGE